MSTIKANQIDSLNGTDEVDIPTLEQRFAKAWVVFNQSTNVIVDSYNISSITDLATGNTRVNYENTLDNNAYSSIACATSVNDSANRISNTDMTTQNTSKIDINYRANGVVQDSTRISVVIF